MTVNKSFFLSFVIGSLLLPNANGQLAITEAMSSASNTPGAQHSDYWELTNFGTNQINLTGYKWDDNSSNLAAGDSAPFEGVVIGPGESIVLVQNDIDSTAAMVRDWWGANLGPNVQILFYSGNGLSSTGDGIRLWSPTATDPADTVDSVDFAEAVRGSSFTYDMNSGVFGVISSNTVRGAFQSANNGDTGSPGQTDGPTPLQITQQPTNLVVNPGDIARFSVAVQGRPRGQIQWFFNNTAIAGAQGTTLSVTNVQAANTGSYQASISNGVTNVATVSAALVLQSDASGPVIIQAPGDIAMTAGESYTFRAGATGLPTPAFEWRFNGETLVGENNSELTLSGVTEAQSGVYSVVARNALGATTNSFQVIVAQTLPLAVTEVMSSSQTNGPAHGDFWELTNLGSYPIPLKGFRFDDNSEMLSDAFTFTNNIVVAPGESIVFVEVLTADAFREWWGAANLPPSLQIITYRGNGLSSGGDAVNLYSAAASDDSDKVTSVVFSTATMGVSFEYKTNSPEGTLSVAGVNGAFAAAVSGDIGSAGFIRNNTNVVIRINSITLSGTNLRLAWSSQPGKNYDVQTRDSLDASAVWTKVETVPSDGATTSKEIPFSGTPSRRFFRIAKVP